MRAPNYIALGVHLFAVAMVAIVVPAIVVGRKLYGWLPGAAVVTTGAIVIVTSTLAELLATESAMSRSSGALVVSHCPPGYRRAYARGRTVCVATDDARIVNRDGKRYVLARDELDRALSDHLDLSTVDAKYRDDSAKRRGEYADSTCRSLRGVPWPELKTALCGGT